MGYVGVSYPLCQAKADVWCKQVGLGGKQSSLPREHPLSLHT